MNDNITTELCNLIEERGEIRYTVTHDLFADAMERIARKIEHDGEQAIEASLAEHGFVRERTCHCETSNDSWCFSCSECLKSFPRHELHQAHNHGEINYCPNCGARVEHE